MSWIDDYLDGYDGSVSCDRCGEEIDFVEMRSGKKFPVDPDPVSVTRCEAGDEVITASGKFHVVTPGLFGGLKRPELVYLSHFYTCRFREERKAEEAADDFPDDI